MLKRIRHSISHSLLRLVDLRFPLVFAFLSAEEKKEAKDLMQRGDILLEDNGTQLLGQIAHRLIACRWSHAAIYVGDGTVIDVGTKPYVARIKLDDFLRTTDLAIYRPQYHDSENVEAALEFVEDHLGYPLNSSFSLSSTKSMYCSQLIYEALRHMPNPIELRVLRIFNGLYVLPTAVEESSQLDLVWQKRTNPFWRIVTHLPTILPAAVGYLIGSSICLTAAITGVLLAVSATLLYTNVLCRKGA